MSFIYELTENFYFPNKKTIEIYNNYNIEIIFPYHILTETERTCLTNYAHLNRGFVNLVDMVRPTDLGS